MRANNEYVPIFGPHGQQNSHVQQYTDRRAEILQSCLKTAPGGGKYIKLGEFYQKLREQQ